MAKLKKSAAKSKSTSRKTAPADLQAKAEQLSRGLADSAQQIWLAGMGAFQRAQHEGSKLFETLVKEGSGLETATRKMATGRVDAVRDAVEERVGSVRERAVDTWDRLEKVFEERVQRALTRLGVPGKEDLAELVARVDALTKAVKQREGAAAKAAPASKTVKAAPTKAKKPVKAEKKAAPAKTTKPKAAKAPAKARKATKAALAPIAAPDAPQA